MREMKEEGVAEEEGGGPLVAMVMVGGKRVEEV